MIDSASPTATGLSSAAPIEPVPVSPVPASTPSAEALVQMMASWGVTPAAKWNKHYSFFAPMRLRIMKEYALDPNEMMEATLLAFAEIAEALDAQAIEARRAATGTGAVHESAVPKGCAQ